MADVYMPTDEERAVLRAISRGACRLGTHTDRDKVSASVARRLAALGYVRIVGTRAQLTEAGIAARQRIS